LKILPGQKIDVVYKRAVRRIKINNNGNNFMKSSKEKSFFCSWSGGKDSCLALYYAVQNGYTSKCLLTMLTGNGEKTRSHGIPISVLKQQAEALAIPLTVCSTSWNNYEATFLSAICDLKERGIELGVFGDIDLDAHRQWCEKVCSVASIQHCHPLWKKGRRDLLNEFIRLNFKATIIAVKKSVLDKEFLGKTFNSDVINEIENTGIDVSGEEGEYHTIVTDGPIFSCTVNLVLGKPVLHNGYWLLDIS